MVLKKKKFIYLNLFVLIVLVVSCTTNPNLNKKNQDKFEAAIANHEPDSLTYLDTTYVPIYSDIYSQTKDVRFNLTATLSLRNTSFDHSIYVHEVDYYNSKGIKIRSFITNPIELKPMQSVEYVIEEKDTSGGTGANFIINWGSTSTKVKPIFEAVMISTNGQQGVSFTTRGISIKTDE